MFVRTEYLSKDIPIPASFLSAPPAAPVVARHIDWPSSPLPDYEGHTALVLDNVLSPAECEQLLSLAEASAPGDEDGGASSPWRPALISVAEGLEAAAPGYRESDRIIWDQQVVADRIWGRIAQAEGVRELLASVPERWQGSEWRFERMNERMRFLKYSPGQFFKPHCDAPYGYTKDGVSFKTHYTVQLYLNDSAAADPSSALVGGATSFLSGDRARRLDTNPKAGSVLLFQHSGLFHEGAIVKRGVKYTMRTDIIYRLI